MISLFLYDMYVQPLATLRLKAQVSRDPRSASQLGEQKNLDSWDKALEFIERCSGCMRRWENSILDASVTSFANIRLKY